MPNYRKIVRKAYLDILGREPDPGGLANYNSLMNGSMSEAVMREALLRSAEYKDANPDAPPPPPPPPGGAAMALKVMDGKFIDPTGAVVSPQGAISCCADADPDSPGALEYGWPLVNEAFLDLMAAHKLNFVHVRLGPMVSKDVDPKGEPRNDVQAYALAPGGKQYDLDRWNDAYWSRLGRLIAYARERRIYFQVDIDDTWVKQHRVSPWNAAYNIQGWEGADLALMRQRPTTRHEQWIRKVVRETASFDNVLYQDGNESFKATSRAWCFGMRDIVADEHGRMGILSVRPFGTNSQNEEIERGCDYGVWHERQAPDPTTYPRMTNEYGDMTPAAVLDQVRIAWTSGGSVSFHYWRGGHSGKDFLATLTAIEHIVDGTDAPPAIPDSCPTLVKWGSKVHQFMTPAFQTSSGPVRDGYCVVDSTPRFGSGRGEPCNDEHPGCGGRKCEDPRGGLWTLEEGDPTAPLHLQSEDFQCRVGPMRRGHYKLRVRPRPDAKDHYGKPLTVVGDVSTTTEWDVP